MDLRTMFHIIAALCAGAVIIITTLGPFQNKIVIVVVLVAIGLVFEIAIPFIKTSKPPIFNYSLKLLDSDYAEGVEVDDNEWIEGFKRYEFKLTTAKHTVQANDIRMAFVFPTGIVGYKIISNNGCGDINFPARSTSFHHLNENNQMIDNIPFYQNLLYLNISDIQPNSSFTLHLILTYQGPWDEVNEFIDRYGLFDIQYHYSDPEDNENSFRYAILFKDKKKKELIIETSKEANAELKFFHIMMPKEKIRFPFEKGSGIKFHGLPGRLRESDNEEGK